MPGIPVICLDLKLLNVSFQKEVYRSYIPMYTPKIHQKNPQGLWKSIKIPKVWISIGRSSQEVPTLFWKKNALCRIWSYRSWPWILKRDLQPPRSGLGKLQLEKSCNTPEQKWKKLGELYISSIPQLLGGAYAILSIQHVTKLPKVVLSVTLKSDFADPKDFHRALIYNHSLPQNPDKTI